MPRSDKSSHPVPLILAALFLVANVPPAGPTVFGFIAFLPLAYLLLWHFKTQLPKPTEKKRRQWGMGCLTAAFIVFWFISLSGGSFNLIFILILIPWVIMKVQWLVVQGKAARKLALALIYSIVLIAMAVGAEVLYFMAIVEWYKRYPERHRASDTHEVLTRLVQAEAEEKASTGHYAPLDNFRAEIDSRTKYGQPLRIRDFYDLQPCAPLTDPGFCFAAVPRRAGDPYMRVDQTGVVRCETGRVPDEKSPECHRQEIDNWKINHPSHALKDK